MYAFRMVGSPKCLRNSGALEVVRESIPKIDAISFFADIEHKCTAQQLKSIEPTEQVIRFKSVLRSTVRQREYLKA